MQPPILTSSDCEGAGEVFAVSANVAQAPRTADSVLNLQKDSFFRQAQYLTVSSQLHLEAYMHEYPKVWSLSPTFRAEKSDTPRHVSEFWMLEVEVRTQSLDEIMDMVEDMIRHTVKSLRQTKVYEELTNTSRDAEDRREGKTKVSDMIAQRWHGLMKAYWPRITYSEVMRLLTKVEREEDYQFHFKPRWEDGIQLEHEKIIADRIGQGGPVFVTDYPEHLKPFYMLPSNDNASNNADDPRTVACFDLIMPEICEVVGGSLREHRLDQLLQSMDRKGQRQELDRTEHEADTLGKGSQASQDLDWYTDLRRYGSVPHGGFGLGLDRLLGYLAGVHNVRDVIPWPRYHGRCYG